MSFLFVFTILLGLCIGDFFFKRRRNRILKASGIRGPSYTLPIFGDISVALQNTTANVNILFTTLGHQFGKVSRLWLFHRLGLVIADPKYFEVVLSSQSATKKAYSYDILSNWLGDGLLLSHGSKWHARRKILTPTFHFKILEQFVEVFDQQSQILVKKLKPQADGKTVINIFPLVCLAALDIVLETSMGVKMNAQGKPDLLYVKEVKRASVIMGTRVVKPQYFFDILFMLLAFPSYLRLRKSIKIMHDFTDKIIAERRSKIITNNSQTTKMDADDLNVGQKQRLAFIDVLLAATINEQPLTNRDIREEIDTFMFEGHDTTSSAVAFCLYLLSRHAAIQQQAFEEAKEILGTKQEETFVMRDLHELKYLEAVIKESLRLYPAVPFIGREILQDLKIGDQTIPADTHICLLIYAAGRDPDYFPEPNAFKPERFLGDNCLKINPFAYVPFSAGPRNCIGQKFAMLAMKNIISRVLLNFELLPLGQAVAVENNLVMRSSTGMNLGLKLRSK